MATEVVIGRGLNTDLSTLLPVGSPPRPTLLTPAFTHPRPSSLPLGSTSQRCERNTGYQPMQCCINAVAPSLQVHGDSSWDGSGRSLGSPESQCSIGFQPVFCSHVERCF